MNARKLLFLVLILNSVVVIAALEINRRSGVNHFDEGKFVTIYSFLQLLATFGIVLLINWYSRWKNPSLIWKIIAIGFIFLAADEVFTIHENIDFLIHRVFGIEETAVTDRIDDILVGLYGLLGIGVLFVYRNEWKIYREAFPFFIFGFALLFGMVIITNRHDILYLIWDHHSASTIQSYLSLAEEPLKVFSEAFFILGFYIILQTVKAGKKESAVTKAG
ncbi:hypothetical protein OO006_00615 [Prosthecochloris sp. SCSIO W1101]|uniref:hypothetical protein n=1 Tax=Prosthecochloris sp. SCSIO W1101 TaxID=2992242 RepID=UPI00223D0CAB|nr:hypothetical protein [Prosthecochloris sp. SCSIO W1101]UZJ41546.1 hypothetical protein OO006_00615 [Prosthecochloris sp. SCSIO W1101]